MTNWWKIMAGRGGIYFDEFMSKGVVVFGGEGLDDIRGKTKDALVAKAKTLYPDDKPKQLQTWINQLWRFVFEISHGDRIVVFNPRDRSYSIGTVAGAYQYKPDFLAPGYSHVYPITWETRRVPRDSLPVTCQNTLGSILTIFQINSCAESLEAVLRGISESPTATPASPSIVPADSDEDDWFTNLQGIVRERTADKIVKLDPWQLQDLVAGLLEAMGYRTRVSPPGPDGGVDVLAHPDEFGFGQPVIKVQVKHRRGSASAAEIRQLLGANPRGANSLFVSTGGYTSTARAEAQRENVVLLELDDLVEKVGLYYDRLPTQVQALLPMQRMYIPL